MLRQEVPLHLLEKARTKSGYGLLICHHVDAQGWRELEGSAFAFAVYTRYWKCSSSHPYSPRHWYRGICHAALEEFEQFSRRYAKVRQIDKLVADRGRDTDQKTRFYCFGPAKSPLHMSANEYSDWHGLQTPIIFNHHEPMEVNSSTINHVNLNEIVSTRNAVKNNERILILTPLRDAAPYLMKYFELLSQITYPHDLIDLGFLVGDSDDTTMSDLVAELERLQKRTDNLPFRSVTIVEKDFHVAIPQDVEERHGFAAQGPRRKSIGRARNYLLYSALKPEHAWVYWRDVDIVDSPRPIIEDMIAHDTDIIVPNIWFHRYDNQNRDIEGRCKLCVLHIHRAQLTHHSRLQLVAGV